MPGAVELQFQVSDSGLAGFVFKALQYSAASNREHANFQILIVHGGSSSCQCPERRSCAPESHLLARFQSQEKALKEGMTRSSVSWRADKGVQEFGIPKIRKLTTQKWRE